MARSGSPMRAATRARNLNRRRDQQCILFDRIQCHATLGQSQRDGFVSQTHVGQCEIAKQLKIFRLFLEKMFQFAARLPPGFLGGGLVASHFLGPA